jgi:hypothetical protein
MRVLLQTWCQIQRSSFRLRYLDYGPGHIQCIYSYSNSGFLIQLNVCELLLQIYRQFNVRITANMVPIQRTFFSLRCLNRGIGHIQWKYSSAYSGFNIQLIVSALLLEISRQFNVRYTANLVPNTEHIHRFTLYDVCSRTYTIYFQLLIIRLQYSIERICAAIGYNRTLRCPLYLACCLGHIQCNYSSTYSGFNIHLNVSALLWEICRQFNVRYSATMVPNTGHILQFTLSGLWSRAIYNVITVPHI